MADFARGVEEADSTRGAEYSILYCRFGSPQYCTVRCACSTTLMNETKSIINRGDILMSHTVLLLYTYTGS